MSLVCPPAVLASIPFAQGPSLCSFLQSLLALRGVPAGPDSLPLPRLLLLFHRLPANPPAGPGCPHVRLGPSSKDQGGGNTAEHRRRAREQRWAGTEVVTSRWRGLGTVHQGGLARLVHRARVFWGLAPARQSCCSHGYLAAAACGQRMDGVLSPRACRPPRGCALPFPLLNATGPQLHHGVSNYLFCLRCQ